MSAPENGFSKKERVCGKNSVSSLLSRGRWGSAGAVKYCWKRREDGSEVCRILVSVPKKFFKRAVKRNLLKRRIREAYRVRKNICGLSGVDIMFVYNSPELRSQEELGNDVRSVLEVVSSHNEERK